MILYEDYCPSSEIWQRFLVGELTESGVEQLYGHLDQCALCIGLLGALASRSFVQSRGPGGEGLAAPPLLPPESPLRRVGPDGRFELVYTVGTGGMGTVFAAVDHAHRGGADSAALLVAVKLMRPAGDARQRAESILRFKREFRAVQSLSQPNLVTLHELIQDGDELLLVMELVPGVDLLTYLERGTPAPAQYTARLRALLPQLVAALHHLHAAGIVHRDLKPSNILVKVGGHVVVLDFGLVAELDELGAGERRQVVGTLAYMAPEQAAGRNVVAAADWYSLGVLLYQAVTGRLPRRGTASESTTTPADFLGGRLDAESARLLWPAVAGLLEPDPGRRSQGDELLSWVASAYPAPPVLAADGAAPAAALSNALATDPSRVRFVGRAAELAHLHAALAAVQRGQFRCVVVQGESGIGKSSLLKRFSTDIAGGSRAGVALLGQCSERESIPYQALDGLIDGLSWALLHQTPTTLSNMLPQQIGVLARVFPVLRRVPAIAQAPMPDIADPVERSRQTARALRELLTRLAHHVPVVLLIDDAQWADADSMQLLQIVLAEPAPPPILVVLAARSERPLVPPAWPAETLAIGPLPEQDALALIERLTAGTATPLPDLERRRIISESGGQPLFLAELARRTLAGESGRALSVADLLAERVFEQPPERRRLLEVCALAVRPQPHAVLARLSQLPWPDYIRAVLMLRSQRLLRTQLAGSLIVVEPYHDRVRQAVMALTAESTASAHHAALVAAIEANRPNDFEVIAYHLKHSGQLRQAVSYYKAAGDQAFATQAWMHAAALFREALELGGEPADSRLRVQLAETLANAGRGAESAAIYLQAAACAPTDERLRLEQRAVHQLLSCGHKVQGLRLLRQLLSELGVYIPASSLAPGGPVGVLGRLSSTVYVLGLLIWLNVRGLSYHQRPLAPALAPSTSDAASTEEQLRTASARDRQSSRDALRVEAFLSAAIHISSVDYVLMLAISIRCVLLALKNGDEQLLVSSMAFHLFSRAMGSFGKFSKKLAQQLHFIEQIADRQREELLSTYCLHVRAMGQMISGRWRDAIALLGRAESRFVDHCIGTNWIAGSVRFFLAQALFLHGDLGALRRMVTAAHQDARERGDSLNITRLATGLASIAWLVGDEADQGAAWVAEAVQLWQRPMSPFIQYIVLLARVAGSLYRGNGSEALGLIRSGWPRRVTRGIPLFSCMLHWLRGAAALTQAAHSELALRRRLHAQAASDAGYLWRAGLSWTRALALLLRATIQTQQGLIELALPALHTAVQQLREAELLAYAAAAEWRIGELVGSRDGQQQIAAADLWLHQQGVVAPTRMVQLLAPPLCSDSQGTAAGQT